MSCQSYLPLPIVRAFGHRRRLLAMPQPEPAAREAAADYRGRYEEITGTSLTECPACHQGRMLVIEVINPTKPCPPIHDTS
jgi:hypothetical protein